MRILFHGPSISSTRPSVSLPYLTGITAGTNSPTVNSLRQPFNLTGNTGNIIHAEAPMKFLSYDIGASAISDLHRLYSSFSSAEAFRDSIKENYDCVVLSLANLIRPDFNTNLHEILEAIGVPFYVFGVGLQNDVKLASLRPNTQKLLKVLNDKSALFGCRGYRTEEWLHSNGFRNAIALGCPSLYVYPHAVLNNQDVDLRDVRNVVTAGHLSDTYLSSDESVKKERVDSITALCDRFENVSYVFQDEPFTYKELLDVTGLWKDQVSQFDADTLNSYLSVRLQRDVSFKNFYMFYCSSTWRSTVSKYDLFLGDRLHAGIAARQAGLPSVILYGDVRVKELTDFYNFPSLPVSSVLDKDFHGKLRDVLSVKQHDEFTSTYMTRLSNFIYVVKKSGLKLKPAYHAVSKPVSQSLESLRKQRFDILERANYLREKLSNDGGDMLYVEALCRNSRKREAWKCLTDSMSQGGKRSNLYRLFAIEKSIQLRKAYDAKPDLSEICSSSALPKAEQKLLSRILNLDSKTQIFSIEDVLRLLENDQRDCFDACVGWLIKSDRREQAIVFLREKVLQGFGTRVRVKQLIQLLISQKDISSARLMLEEFGKFLARDMEAVFRKQLSQ